MRLDAQKQKYFHHSCFSVTRSHSFIHPFIYSFIPEKYVQFCAAILSNIIFLLKVLLKDLHLFLLWVKEKKYIFSFEAHWLVFLLLFDKTEWISLMFCTPAPSVGAEISGQEGVQRTINKQTKKLLCGRFVLFFPPGVWMGCGFG